MRFLARFAQGELRLNRIEAFSDGVFAIVVTLLVLELKVPALAHHDSVAELGARLLELVPKFLSWLISFVIVCKFWLNQHHIFGMARHADYTLIWLNALFLMFQSFIPFPTAMMGEYPSNPLAVTFFGAVMALNTVLFILMHRYILRRLAKPGVAAAQDPHIIAKSFVGVVCYALGAGAAWIDVRAAFVVYFLTPLFFIVPPQRGAPEERPRS